MRRFTVALVLPLLLVACASQPPQKLAGKYAVVLDPELGMRGRGTPLLHQFVRTSLMHRLDLVPAAADADAVIVLKSGRTPGRLDYEIRRGEKSVRHSAAIPMIAPGSQRSIGEQLEAQRNDEYARGDNHMMPITRRDPVTRRPSPPTYESAQVEAIFAAGNRIAADIVRELARM